MNIDDDIEASPESNVAGPRDLGLVAVHRGVDPSTGNEDVEEYHVIEDEEEQDESQIDNDVNINENIETSSAPDSPESSAIHEFDMTLPSSHSYLGSNLQELRGRTLLDEGIYMNLPLLIRESVVLFPGQILPLAKFGRSVVEMLLKCISDNRTFGVLCYRDDKLQTIGTTAEIYQYNEENSPEGFCIKAIGRQKFEVLRIIHGFQKVSANVKILPEIVLPSPFADYRSFSLDFQRGQFDKINNHKKEKIEKVEAMLTHWPSWVYKQFDPQSLASHIKHHLTHIETRGSHAPDDPIELSYWVAQNLPLTDDERVLLLKFDCAISRLQWELKYLTKDRYLACSNCGIQIGKQSDVFPMSKEGPQNTFCNSGGFVHDTITLYDVSNIILSGEQPSTEYSWFPGYAWTIAYCERCNDHKGWCFEAHNDKSLRPQSFWGLTRRGLKSIKGDLIEDLYELDPGLVVPSLLDTLLRH
ncbi:protein cereblon [Trichogramma pretiosum]|uniref:protein cereblon n=1 Tax=Trichogramma pretiosum TaxID=7493 RepID=UPI0006C9D336|nr:protein cereblon [Trichogramma pretiosum]